MSKAADECVACEVGGLKEGDARVWRDGRVALIAASGLLLLIGLVLHFILELHLIAEILFLVTAVITGYDIARKGVYSLIAHRRIPINLLVVTAANRQLHDRTWRGGCRGPAALLHS